MITKEQLEELKKLERECTTGPWSFVEDAPYSDGEGVYGADNEQITAMTCEGCGGFRHQDHKFIAAARNALPELIAEVERLQKFVNALSDEHYEAQVKENQRLREALELIAAQKRPDGTYNRCREACEKLAREALGMKEEG